jgi:hypothetical protein
MAILGVTSKYSTFAVFSSPTGGFKPKANVEYLDVTPIAGFEVFMVVSEL